MKIHYAKPYLTIDEQIDLLVRRGLRIRDRSVARDLLAGVNYYRLTGYAIPFSIDREHFKPKADLSDLVAEIPIWAAVEVCSFGTLTKLYSNLKKPYQQKIARVYSIKCDILDSYLHHLVVMRNCCAHHARLFDRKFFGYRPLNEWRNTQNAALDTRTFFAQLLLVYRMLRSLPQICFDRKRWRKGVFRLLSAAPSCAVFDISRIMDIPPNFRKSKLWL